MFHPVKDRSAPLYLLIAVLLAGVFAVDMNVPLGIAVWVFYMLPVGLCIFGPLAFAPLLVALLSSALTAYAFYMSPPSALVQVSFMNRCFGIFVLWAMALFAQQFVSARMKLRRLTWLQQSEARISEKLVGDQSLAELGGNLLEFMVGLLDAQAAVIYKLDNGVLRRVAAWAPESSTSPPTEILPGHGLIGQTLVSGKMLVLRDVPPDHVHVASGLGRSTPRQLVIAPLMAEGDINGVLELGFMSATQKLVDTAELLSEVREVIGVALRSAIYRRRLEELLEKTQRQSEELQVQQEELRTSNEELEEHARVLRDSQARLENQQSELEQTNVQLEEQAERVERHRQELVASQGELQRNSQALRQASQYKSEFLANMSHELRTPLNSSLILAKLLADNKPGTLTTDQVRYAQTIQSSNNDLLTLINDILDLSKIEAGHLTIHPEQTTVLALLDPMRRLFEPLAAERGLALHIEVAPGAPESMVTDVPRLQQVLKNLLSNALKFTEQGEVRLRVEARPGGNLAIEVRDSGIGIAPEQHDNIFEAFRQADGTTSRKYGGTGLGLSISRELVKLLGGEVTLRSALGEGSSFTVRLPVEGPQIAGARVANAGASGRAGEARSRGPAHGHAKAIANANASEDAVSRVDAPAGASVDAPRRAPSIADDRASLTRPGRLILVIEDDLAFARILYDMAHELDFDCLHASTTAEGLVLAREHRPSGVLLDMNLPDGSGLSVLEQLKRDPQTRHVPVHVMSVDDHASTALALGAIGYAMKPVARERVAEAIASLEERLSHKLRRVLVVEDDATLRDNIVLLLQSDDVDITAVGTVALALVALAARTFDCMVMDLVLPDASGYELLEKIGDGSPYGFPPVIVYTGRALTRDEEQRLSRYSKSIIIKGARSPERLLDEVTLFLHRVESDLPSDQQRMLREARQRDATFEGRVVLLAEDDVRNIFALSHVLEPLGCKLRIARNGREALDQVKAQDDIDMVLMDVMMPEMDGLTAMQEIRRLPAFAKLPIIALTAKAMPEDRQKCLEAGANDYISKPIDVDKLVSLCRVWMPKT
ncbi:MAG: histidine kinase [Rhizobacter sp.]|nr:histidine kinase [Rhizobacter sp.]